MIDFVLPWVDGNDPLWQKEKAKYNPNHDNDSNASARFRDMGTLKYVLRAIEQNCPWYNKIYIITTGHYPDWLDIEHEKIVLVTHDELYFDKTHLPVFSSSSIEMNLANIKGLSEKFVYLNDDMIIMKNLEKDRFFIDNKPVDFLSHGWIARGKIFEMLKGRDSWIHSLNNNLNLINKKVSPLKINKNSLFHTSYSFKSKVSNFLLKNIYKKFLWIEHWHHPQPYLKNTLLDVYKEFEEDMMRCSSNRFRANNDLTQYLYRYWHLAKNNFYAYRHNDDYIANISSLNVLESMLKEIDTNNTINFVCFNDSPSLGDNEYEEIKGKLVEYLEGCFPAKASFEV
jgi:hypothetical protein